MKPVLLSALAAVMLVSPALAATKTASPAKPACFTAEQVLQAAPPGAKFVQKLSADEVKNFARHAKINDDIDGVNIYSSNGGRTVGASTFFTFKGGCVVGAGAFKTDLLKSLLSPEDGSL